MMGYQIIDVKMTIKYFIYKITNPSNKFYIGRTNDMKRRVSQYKSIKRIKDQKLIEASILKYGFVNHTFEILEEGFGSPEFISEREIYYIDLHNSVRKNNKNGLNIVRGSKGGDYRKTTTNSEKQIKAAIKNLEKAIEFNKTERVYPPMSKKQKEQIALKNSGVNHVASKTIFNTETGIYYDSIRECASCHNISPSTVSAHLLGYVKDSVKPFIYA